MEKIIINLKTKSPLLIKANNDNSNMLSSLDYIPGSQLRGKLAKYFLNDALYENIFLQDKVKFNNLYISGSKIVPLSAITCKYYPGFLNDEKEEKHGVFDLLLDKLNIYKNYTNIDKLESYCIKKINTKDPILGTKIKGKYCNSVLKPFKGYYSDNMARYKNNNVNKRQIEKTALNLKDEVAKEGSLYVMDLIEAEQEFIGEIDIISENTNINKRLKEVLSNIEYEYFGTAISSGHGKVKLDYNSKIVSEEDFRSKQEERFINLNDKIEDEKIYFTVNLNSDMIIYDDFLRAKKKLEMTDILNYSPYLSREEKSELGKFNLVKGSKGQLYFSDMKPIYGWNKVMRLPKPIEMGIIKGSVFIYEGNKEDIDLDLLISSFLKLETRGIGERLNEGYGKITINDKFHYENLKEGK